MSPRPTPTSTAGRPCRSKPLRRAATAALACLASALAGACGPAAPRATVELSTDAAAEPGRREDVWLRVSAPLGRAEWSRAEDGSWSAPDPFAGAGFGDEAERIEPRLVLDGSTHELAAEDGRVWTLPSGAAPPQGLARLQRGVRAGTRAGDVPPARLQAGGRTSDGLVLHARATAGDHSQRFALRVEPGDRLRFGCSVIGRPMGDAHPLRLALAGEELATGLALEPARSVSQFDRVELRVPADVSGAVELELTNRADEAVVLLHTPRVVPAEFERLRALDPRPDLLLVVVDTLRADAVGAFGGAAGVTPTLDALAAEGLVFENAVASSSWTLPSHASMLSGLHPHQHGATEPSRALPAVVTLAQRLADAGYRTGAVTNGAFVSAAYGMDRGFQTFLEVPPSDLESTLGGAVEFLRARDERPSFLFLQTYRVHTPYHADADSHAAVGSDEAVGTAVQLGLLRAAQQVAGSEGAGSPLLRLVREGRWSAVIDAFLERSGLPADEQQERVAAPLRSTYLAGVHAFDRAFAAFRSALADEGLDRRLALCVTSDHGEAFDDEGDWFHGRGVSRAMLHVPLFLHGPGIEPGRSARPASSVDLPRTLAAVAGVEPWPSWGGEDLLSARLRSGDRTVLSFDCAAPGRASVSLTTGEHRILLEDAGAPPAPDGDVRRLPLAGAPGAGTRTTLDERQQALLEAAYQRLSEARAARANADLESLGY